MKLSLRPLWTVASQYAGRPVEVRFVTGDEFRELGYGGRASVHPDKPGTLLIELCHTWIDGATGTVRKGFAHAFWHEVAHCKNWRRDLAGELLPGARLSTQEALSAQRSGKRAATSHDAGVPPAIEADANAFATKMVAAGYGTAWLVDVMRSG